MNMTCEQCRAVLSAHLEGDLDAKTRQAADEHMSGCPVCAEEMMIMKHMMDAMSNMHVADPGLEAWKQFHSGLYNNLERGAVWLLYGGGLAVLAGYGAFEFLRDPGLPALLKVLIAAPVVGVVVLFISVLRERMRASRSDRYSKEVEL